MKKNISLICIVVFVSTFSFIYFVLQLFVKNINNDYKEETKDQTEIILSNVSSRLRIFMDLPLMLGKIGSEYFRDNPMNQKSLNKLCEGIFQTNRDILGLNLLNNRGEIIAVYPRSKNFKAIGKKTQNLANLKDSIASKEEFWFSQPFELYQKGEGFGIYVPIQKSGVVRGWFAVIMNTQNFIADFNIDRPMKHYEINIIDNQSRQPFMQTSLFTPSGKNQRIYSERVHGRNLNYVIWPKKNFKAPIQESEIIILSLFFALMALFIGFLIRYRWENIHRLDEMTTLLKLTHREAMEKLIDLQSEFYKLGATENIRYIHQMIEQLDILQSSMHSTHRIDDENEDIVKTLEQVLEEQKYFIRKKSLKLDFEFLKKKRIYFRTNKWLFRNSVVSNIITHSVLLGAHGTSLTVNIGSIPGKCVLIFRLQQTLSYGFEGEEQDFEKHLEVARKVMTFYGGDISCDRDLAGGLLIRIYIPHLEDKKKSYINWIFQRTKLSMTNDKY